MALATAIVLVAAGALVETTASAAPENNRGKNSVVLGSKKYAPYGKGFGKAKPRVVFNGGAASGLVKRIAWRNWGARRSIGRGRGYQYRPGGGYYSRTVGVRFRAYDIGHCRGSGKRAYTRLQARFQRKPGGKFGDWFDWSGSGTICSY